MATVYLSTFGTLGDVRPFVALAAAMNRRGHRAILFTNPADAPRAAAAGVEWCGVGPAVDIQQTIAANPQYMGIQAGKHVLKDAFIPFSRELFRVMGQRIVRERPACVVSHIGCFGGVWAAERASVPSVIVHLAPTSLFSRRSFDYLPPARRMLVQATIPLACFMADRWLNGLRRELGLPSPKDIFRRTTQTGDLVVCLWSPLFRGLAAEDAQTVTICGFPRYGEPPGAIPAELKAFLDAGESPVVFTLGTSAVAVAGDFYSQAAAACRLIGRRGVLLCGPSAPADLPEDVLAVPYAPFAEVFPRAAAVVHHGGIGTVGQCVLAGRAGVIVPFGHDQYDNAQRLKALGVGAVVSRRRAKARPLAAALGQVLRPGVRRRAEQLAQRVRDEPGGIAVAAERIDRLIG